jgi:hypothetical protein
VQIRNCRAPRSRPSSCPGVTARFVEPTGSSQADCAGGCCGGTAAGADASPAAPTCPARALDRAARRSSWRPTARLLARLIEQGVKHTSRIGRSPRRPASTIALDCCGLNVRSFLVLFLRPPQGSERPSPQAISWKPSTTNQVLVRRLAATTSRADAFAGERHDLEGLGCRSGCGGRREVTAPACFRVPSLRRRSSSYHAVPPTAHCTAHARLLRTSPRSRRRRRQRRGHI